MHLAFYAAVLALLSFEVARSDGDQCSTYYRRYCKDHSGCLPANSSCEIISYYPSDEDIELIMQLHNKYRNMIAEGAGENMPPAANMMQLEWDDELAFVAQNYAQQCIYAHDKANCRQVMSYEVGQNLAFQSATGHQVPQPDWRFAVDNWYEEIKNFDKKDIAVYNGGPKDLTKETRHFTQLIWAASYRVGCGFVLYKTGDDFKKLTFTRLYVCDYGPAGNFVDAKVYEEGDACSHCPENACCGSSCDDNNAYPGLCRRTGNSPPHYPPPQNTLFYCSFHYEPDCDGYGTGDPEFKIEITQRRGYYYSAVLKGGQNSTYVFKKAVQPTDPSNFCLTVLYRLGPNRDGDEDAGVAKLITQVPSNSFTYAVDLIGGTGVQSRHQFKNMNTTLGWGASTQFSVNFYVPPDKPDQFFDLQLVMASDGECK